jgi:Salmonella virulence plasmid 65kDa B protein
MAKPASSEVITLPKGGVALHGLGEKFSPDLHTGTGNFTIPIAFPSGRNGFQPQLNLAYSTGNGNGSFGLGWNLSTNARNEERQTPYPTPNRSNPQSQEDKKRA